MSGSTMLLMTSNGEAPLALAGSMSSILSHCAQVSVPPRRGCASVDDADDADVGPAAGWHAARTPSPAMARAPTLRVMNCLRVAVMCNPPFAEEAPSCGDLSGTEIDVDAIANNVRPQIIERLERGQ